MEETGFGDGTDLFVEVELIIKNDAGIFYTGVDVG